MPKTTPQLRQAWSEFECAETTMVLIPFGPDKIRVAPPTVAAWEALASVLLYHNYQIRTKDTDSYNCRAITGGNGRSLHSYGIALDINWTTNPYNDHEGKRTVRFSPKATQAERAQDVRHGLADTDMTEAMIDDVVRIKTNDGLQVFEWGGEWRDRKDCMHFELDVSPGELAVGVDPATVAGLQAYLGADEPEAAGPAGLASASAPEASVPPPTDRQIIIARGGLRLRAGASPDSDIIRTLPTGTFVNLIGRKGEWALVDLQGDGLADGFVNLGFLRPASVETPGVPAATAARDITELVTEDMVSKMFPFTKRSNIAANLPFVLRGLRNAAVGDRQMVLMALATIRAETEGFVPISEGVSKYNTRHTPFDLYDAGTPKGAELGNTEPGDGPRFKGRGYVQLTGRDNYTRIGAQIGVDLVRQPDAANDPSNAGAILARFLKNHENGIRAALASNDLKKARKLVNGGSHGFDRFEDAYRIGDTVLPR